MATEPNPGSPEPAQPAGSVLDQREWLRVTLTSMGDAVVTADRDGRVTFLNPVAQSITGWTLDEAVGTPLDQVLVIIHERTRRTVENPAIRALRDGLVVELASDTILIAKDGAERPIDDSAAPIRDARGGVAGVVLVFRDGTDRRRKERSLRHALAYVEGIVGTIRESLVVLDQDLRVRTANRTFYQTFRLSPEETENHLVYEIGDHDWDIPKLRALLEGILPSNHSFHDFEVEHDFPGIGRKTMLLNACRVRQEQDSSSLILLAIEDVTERRQAEAAVRDSELRYRRLFETARDGILILDAETGKVTDSNPFMTEMLGYRPDELVGKELWQIGLFRDRESSRAAFRELQERGYIRYEHLPLETKRGDRADVEFISNRYQVDRYSVIQCNIRDITERRQLEQTKEKAESLVDLHRRKDEFLAMLSHELRNPLAPIMNAVQLLALESANENPIQQQARAIIERQVGQLRVMVDELLEVSRITTGRIRLHKETVDMRGIVDRVVELARPLIDQSHHELTVSQPPDPVWLHADPTRLEQVVGNLLTNAAKYTEERGHIWLSIGQVGAQMVLRVRDSGVGIAPDLLPRVFDLFTQAERSLDRSQEGLGVGLTVVHRLVEMHGGRVEVYSALGRGSEFIIRLPIAQLPHFEPQPADSEAAKSPPQSLRVLVVDDNVDHADSTAMLLRRSGHEVRVAYLGTSALESAEEFRPTLVLLDIGLPEMDGFEVARRLRQNRHLEDVRLIAMTGYGQDADRQRSLEAGFDLHLVKPVAAQQLQEALATVTESPSARARDPRPT